MFSKLCLEILAKSPQWKFVAFLMLPLSGVFQTFGPSIEYNESRPNQKFSFSIENALSRDFNTHLEQEFINYLGNFRKGLARLHNEMMSRVFESRPNPFYIWNKDKGFYPVDTIKLLNYDKTSPVYLEKTYNISARRLRHLQDLLGKEGTTLMIGVAPPKVRIYPESVDEYVFNNDKVLQDHLTYDYYLSKWDVNSVAVESALNNLKSQGLDIFASTGFHWNYLAACNITDAFMLKYQVISGVEQRRLDCSNYTFAPSTGTDTDIIRILNILDKDRFIRPSPMPQDTTLNNEPGVEFPRMTVIGDSFSDQVFHYMAKLLPKSQWEPQKLERFISMQHRQEISLEGSIVAKLRGDDDRIFSEFIEKEIIIIVIYNTNVSRNNIEFQEYGLTKKFLSYFFQQSPYMASERKLLFLNDVSLNEDKSSFTLNDQVSRILINKNEDAEDMVEICLSSVAEEGRQILSLYLDDIKVTEIKVASREKCFRPNLNKSPMDTDYVELTISGDDDYKNKNKNKNKILVSFKKFEILENQEKVKKNIPEAFLPKYIDFIEGYPANGLVVTEGVEHRERNENESWRWFTGPESIVSIYNPEHDLRNFILNARAMNGVPIPEQQLDIIVNGRNTKTLRAESLPPGVAIEFEHEISLKPGNNEILFRFSDWNHGPKTYAIHDPRKLALVFTKLEIKAH